MDDYARRAENYRNKAEELRILAERMAGQEARAMMLGIAADYLQMAQTLERLGDTRQKARGPQELA